MAAGWGFLEPWRVVLHESIIRQENVNSAEPTLQVTFTEPNYYSKWPTIHLRLPGDQRDAARLQRLREAMELFTLLAIVNINAFKEVVFSLAVAWLDDHIIYPPIWNVLLAGSLSPQDVAAAQTEVT